MSHTLDTASLHAVFCLAFGVPVGSKQQLIADRLGVQQTMYSRILRGHRTSIHQLASHLMTAGLVELAEIVAQADAAARAQLDAVKVAAKDNLIANVNIHLLRELERLSP